MTFNAARYPGNWRELRAAVLTRAGNRCEGSPAFPDCRAENRQPHPVTGSRVVLTTAHVPGTSTMSQNLEDVRALCQRCHLGLDRASNVAKAAQTKARRRAMLQARAS